MKRMYWTIGPIVMGVMAMSVIHAATAQENQRARRVLYFTKSQGFEHSVVKRDGDRLSHSERILTEVLAQHDIRLDCTKDGTYITAENLKLYDTVMFYTSGDLCAEGGDRSPAMSQEGLEALMAWIRGGGGFIGLHAATDSLRGEQPTEYTKMIGGAFETHGGQEFATLDVVDPAFPAMVGLPVQFRMIDEWYIHNQVNAGDTMHVLIMLDTKSMQQELYNKRAPFPITWCNYEGKGRVFVTALGHREDVWEMPMVQGMIVKALAWTMGDVPGDATPNYKDVVK